MNIRRAVFADAKFLFDLRNEPEVRKNSWNKKSIDCKSHLKWLELTLKNPKRILFIAEKGNVSIGQVRFDISDNQTAEINVSIVKEFRGQGCGTKILVLATNRFLEENHNISFIYAHINPSNAGSKKVFEKAGYEYRGGTVYYKEHQCIEMIYARRCNNILSFQ